MRLSKASRVSRHFLISSSEAISEGGNPLPSMDVAQEQHSTKGIVSQSFELLADMSAQRVGIIAQRLRLLKPAAHCYFFAIAKVE
jgi:hypothetical protein